MKKYGFNLQNVYLYLTWTANNTKPKLPSTFDEQKTEEFKTSEEETPYKKFPTNPNSLLSSFKLGLRTPS